MSFRWVVQSTLGTSADHLSIAEACSKANIECLLYPYVPFSGMLPNTPEEIPTLFYGSTRFVNLCHGAGKWAPGAFFDPDKFVVSYWSKHYKEHWFNHGAELTTLRDFVLVPHSSERMFFVRPDRDLKEFSGSVWSFKDLKRWSSGLMQTDLGDEQLSTIPIWVADPWGISREWRLFMVDGQALEASQYKKDGALKLENGAPNEVRMFAEEMAKTCSPHPVFVLDVCESADSLYVLEVGCVNSAGFYACDIFNIVTSITEWTRNGLV